MHSFYIFCKDNTFFRKLQIFSSYFYDKAIDKTFENVYSNDSYDNYSYDSFVLKIRVFGGYDL